jgi:hypothetical protein
METNLHFTRLGDGLRLSLGRFQQFSFWNVGRNKTANMALRGGEKQAAVFLAAPLP